MKFILSVNNGLILAFINYKNVNLFSNKLCNNKSFSYIHTYMYIFFHFKSFYSIKSPLLLSFFLFPTVHRHTLGVKDL